MVVFTDARLVNHWQGRGCIALAARSVETVSLFLRGRPLKTSAQPTLVLNLDARGQTRFPGGLRARVIIPCVTTGSLLCEEFPCSGAIPGDAVFYCALDYFMPQQPSRDVNPLVIESAGTTMHSLAVFMLKNSGSQWTPTGPQSPMDPKKNPMKNPSHMT
eukprot:638123-Prorocentrum_minimum.AAC.4